MKTAAVISFPIQHLDKLDQQENLRPRIDTVDSPFPKGCVFVFRRNFQKVFFKSFEWPDLEVQVEGNMLSNFYFLLRRNQWGDKSVTCFVSFVCHQESTAKTSVSQMSQHPNFLEVVRLATGVNLETTDSYRIGASRSHPIVEIHDSISPCAAFLHAAWIRLIAVERNQFSAENESSGEVVRYLTSISEIRKNLSQILSIFLSEERSNNTVIRTFMDQQKNKLKLADRYQFLVDVADQSERFADLSSTIRSLRIASAVTNTLSVFAIISVGIGLASLLLAVNSNSLVLENPLSVVSNYKIFVLIGSAAFVAIAVFLITFLVMRIWPKSKV